MKNSRSVPANAGIQILPIILLVGLLVLLWYELFYTKAHELPSALIGQSVPNFSLPGLNSNAQFSTQDLQQNQVVLLNFWATWCDACAAEHAMLMKIHMQYHVPLYSILYKDSDINARDYLAQYGNPYVNTGIDSYGNTAIDFGIYGTPETYVISPAGKIVYRHVGMIDQTNWDKVLYPLILQYNKRG